jgi:predicted metalloprotease with PDZ domain
LPAAGDQGLDRTHTHGRTYWGGALFCLLADVRIREKTQCRKGLIDALRAINRAGGNVANDWTIQKAFEMGDKATGTKVLMTLYGEMGSKPMEVDLPDLWRQLGVERKDGQVILHSDAPLARVRSAISS